MRILPKREVDVRVATERKAQIDEGIALAQRIDKLRQALSALESQHKNFISGMRKELKEQTDSLFLEVVQKKAEIEDLERKRTSLLEPLDASWSAVKAKEQELAVDTQKTAVLSKNLALQETQLNDRKKKEAESLRKVKAREHELDRTCLKVDQLKVETEKGYAKMAEERETQATLRQEKETELLSREAAIASTEREQKMERDRLAEESKGIIKTKAVLEDQRKTLERALNRI